MAETTEGQASSQQFGYATWRVKSIGFSRYGTSTGFAECESAGSTLIGCCRPCSLSDDAAALIWEISEPIQLGRGSSAFFDVNSVSFGDCSWHDRSLYATNGRVTGSAVRSSSALSDSTKCRPPAGEPFRTRLSIESVEWEKDLLLCPKCSRSEQDAIRHYQGSMSDESLKWQAELAAVSN